MSTVEVLLYVFLIEPVFWVRKGMKGAKQNEV